MKEIIERIKMNIELFLDLDFELLTLSGANIQSSINYDSDYVKRLLDDNTRIIKSLKNKPELLNQLNFTYINSLNSHLNNFISQYNAIKNLTKEQLSNQHHSPINTLEQLNNVFRQSGLYSILSPSINIPMLEEELLKIKDDASVMVKEAQDNASIIRGLIPDATATSLSVAIDDRAKLLKKRVNIWLGSVIVILFITSLVSWNFLELDKDEDSKIENTSKVNNFTLDSLKLNENELSNNILDKEANKNIIKSDVEKSKTIIYWIKRLVVFLPLFYLIVFSIRQYNKERKLYEIYIHKKTISQTLPAYMKQAQKEEIMDEIRLRGSTMIFTLPENPDSPIQGSDGIAMNEIKSFLDIKDKLK